MLAECAGLMCWIFDPDEYGCISFLFVPSMLTPTSPINLAVSRQLRASCSALPDTCFIYHSNKNIKLITNVKLIKNIKLIMSIKLIANIHLGKNIESIKN